MSPRINNLFQEAENQDYDYVIIDSAPVGMVTDTIQLSPFIDISIYVVKAGSLDKRMLNIPSRLNKENKLPNMSILINATEIRKGSYGYGYSYGTHKERPWYNRFLKFS
jgi:Mrp family chromosome partitioning ATPase